MIGKSWLSVQHYIQLGFAVMSFILNTFLIFLIIRHSHKTLGAYKYLMIYISAFELFYSLMDVIVKPIFHSYGSTFLVLVDATALGWSTNFGLLMGAIYCGCFGASMAIFGIHFIYRYLVASGNKLLESFNTWKITIWFLVPLLYGVIWGWVAYSPVGQRAATGEHIRSNILETFGLNVEDVAYIGPYFYQKQSNGDYILDVDSIVGMTMVYVIVSSSFFAIICFGIKCNRCISLLTPSCNSLRSRKLQSLLFWALVTQTMIPVVLMHTPVSLVYAFALMDQDIGKVSGFLSMTIAAYPALDPLPSLLIIPCYRNAAKYYLKCCPKTRKRAEDTSTAQQVQRTSNTPM